VAVATGEIRHQVADDRNFLSHAFAGVGGLRRGRLGSEPETVVCIIEAMKVMNEIKSEVKGVVTQVLIEGGKPVEFGQLLFKVRRLEAAANPIPQIPCLKKSWSPIAEKSPSASIRACKELNIRHRRGVFGD